MRKQTVFNLSGQEIEETIGLRADFSAKYEKGTEKGFKPVINHFFMMEDGVKKIYTKAEGRKIVVDYLKKYGVLDENNRVEVSLYPHHEWSIEDRYGDRQSEYKYIMEISVRGELIKLNELSMNKI